MGFILLLLSTYDSFLIACSVDSLQRLFPNPCKFILRTQDFCSTYYVRGNILAPFIIYTISLKNSELRIFFLLETVLSFSVVGYI